jgi:hypothetical protein
MMMSEPAGSRDDHPPRIIGAAEYEFVVIAQPEDHYEVRCSAHTSESQRSKEYVVARIRDIAYRLEAEL